ncbi:MAG: 50S ribosomal protein L15 [Chloroflexi bacterium]|nr:50S ribosomal protein L15 [Chloroflexota bacterium]
MRQHQLRPPQGAKHGRKRVGRGHGSGHGTTSGKGTKGQKARAGGGVRPSFEGGQLPLVKRLPHKRGFTNIFKKSYAVVNVGSLNGFAPNTEVTPEALAEAGLIPSTKAPVKVLGAGELTQGLVVRAAKFSASARAKIQAAGGAAEELARA